MAGEEHVYKIEEQKLSTEKGRIFEVQVKSFIIISFREEMSTPDVCLLPE